ncbi:MAG: NADH-quinone oxidoreductase subunit B family protein [Actinomycetes bacterium]
MPWVTRGLRDGVVTTGYPRRPDPYAEELPGAVAAAVRPGAEQAGDLLDGDLLELCPTGAIGRDPAGVVTVDRGRCLLCGRCVRARPELFSWVPGNQTSRVGRTALVVPEAAEDDTTLAATRADLARRVRIFGRSVHVRHVDVGSDGTEEWEIAALTNPVYDVARLGIFFTASPRHADVLLLTGAGSWGMAEPLVRTVEATARPLVVVAVGTDAASGGLVAPGYAVAGGVAGLLPEGVAVDVWVPGSPPSPFAILHGLLLATGRLVAPGEVRAPRAAARRPR